MLRSRSRDILLLLDCCYGGAFPAGVTVRAAGDLNVLDSFPQERPETGRSRIVISATTSMQFALEGGQLVDGERPRPSVFTAAVVKGLATGEADLDEDGWVSVRELYDYVLDQVRAQNPNQTPTARGDLAGRLYLTRSRRRRVRPAPISAALQNAMTGDTFARLGAVTELRTLVTGADVPAAAGAYEALAKLADDDSRRVTDSAREVLQGVVIQPAQLTVDFGPVPQNSVPPHRTVQLLGPPIALACTPHPFDDWIRGVPRSRRGRTRHLDRYQRRRCQARDHCPEGAIRRGGNHRRGRARSTPRGNRRPAPRTGRSAASPRQPGSRPAGTPGRPGSRRPPPSCW